MTRDEITSGLEHAFTAVGHKELAARRLVAYLTPAHVNAEAGTVTNPNYPVLGPSACGSAYDFIPVPPELMAALTALPGRNTASR
jgi:hypothetical protein